MIQTDKQQQEEGLLTGKVKFVQKAVIFHPQEELFLILQRPPDRSIYQGPWDLPGGKVEYGENHLEAIMREIKEETGLMVGDLHICSIDTFLNEARGIYYIFAGYGCQALDIDVELSGEHLAYQWVDAFYFLRLPSTPFLQKLVREVCGI